MNYKIEKNELKFPTISRNIIDTLQVNLGYKCNQTCKHCHVDAGPHRIEMMSKEMIYLIPKIIKNYNTTLYSNCCFNCFKFNN